jgi:hypothetical protein
VGEKVRGGICLLASHLHVTFRTPPSPILAPHFRPHTATPKPHTTASTRPSTPKPSPNPPASRYAIRLQFASEVACASSNHRHVPRCRPSPQHPL